MRRSKGVKQVLVSKFIKSLFLKSLLFSFTVFSSSEQQQKIKLAGREKRRSVFVPVLRCLISPNWRMLAHLEERRRLSQQPNFNNAPRLRRSRQRWQSNTPHRLQQNLNRGVLFRAPCGKLLSAMKKKLQG